MHYPYQGLKVRVRTDLERVGYRRDYEDLNSTFRAYVFNSPRKRQQLRVELLANEETYDWCDYMVHRADVVTVV